VKIIGVDDVQNWYGISGKTFVWTVEATQERPLVYENGDGSFTALLVGPVPDKLLIPINSDPDAIQVGKDIATGVIEECERLEAQERSKELESSSLTTTDSIEKPYDPIASCMEKYPSLTEEKVLKMAADFGF